MRTMSRSLSVLFLAAATLAVPAAAQTIYRIVGPDGKVTFSDKPPTTEAKVSASSAGGRPLSPQDNALPYELRQVATRYPVTLYGSPSCAPCTAGRQMLQARGIPYTEYSITTPEDNEALRRISNDNVLPVLTVGGQRIKGFSDAEWSQFLDAANYPKNSVLPSSFRFAAARPLVSVQKPEAPKAEDEASAKADGQGTDAGAAATPLPAVSPSNPAGIRF